MALKEVCVAAIDYPSGRTLAGDIVYIRDPLGGVGQKTGEHAIILLIDEADIPQGSLDKHDPMRLCIELDDLIGAHPQVNIDMNRVRNGSDFYQPFIGAVRGDGRTRHQRPVRVPVMTRLGRAVRRQERANGQ